MRIISRKALREFWEDHTDAQQALQSWYSDVKQSQWSFPQEIKDMYRSASIIANNRVAFNIKGNRYRIVVAINYEFGIVYIRFVGTHSEYDKIDATTI
jgi:mRNA interferase HigB